MCRCLVTALFSLLYLNRQAVAAAAAVVAVLVPWAAPLPPVHSTSFRGTNREVGLSSAALPTKPSKR